MKKIKINVRSGKARAKGKSKKKKRNKIDMFCFTRLDPNWTGLPVSIWVEEKSSGSKEPRIIAMKKSGIIDISDSVDILYENEPPEIVGQGLPPEYYERVTAWIVLNKTVLLSHWNFEIDSFQLIERLKKL